MVNKDQLSESIAPGGAYFDFFASGTSYLPRIIEDMVASMLVQAELPPLHLPTLLRDGIFESRSVTKASATRLT